jgi:hypothetical protein
MSTIVLYKSLILQYLFFPLLGSYTRYTVNFIQISLDYDINLPY